MRIYYLMNMVVSNISPLFIRCIFSITHNGHEIKYISRNGYTCTNRGIIFHFQSAGHSRTLHDIPSIILHPYAIFHTRPVGPHGNLPLIQECCL